MSDDLLDPTNQNSSRKSSITIEGITWLEEGARSTLRDEIQKLYGVFDIDETLSLPTGYLSVSQVETYLRCPRQFEFRYIEGIKSPPTGALVQGSGVHAALETGYRARRENPEAQISIEEPMDAFNDYVKQRTESEEIIYGDDTPEKVFRKQGEETVTMWHRDKLHTVNPVAVEKPFVGVLSRIPVVGIVDLIDDTETYGQVVADNKTSKASKPQSTVDSSLQLTLYSAVTRIPNQRWDVYIRPKLGSRGLSPPKLQEVYTIRTFKDVAWLEQVFTAVARAITTGSFPPCSPDAWVCSEKWCGFWKNCRGGM